MNKLKELFRESTKPIILLGGGARNASKEIINFAVLHDIPIQTTWNAIDIISWEHTHFVGRPGIIAPRGANFSIQNCDLLIAIGARLDPSTIAFEYSKFAPKAKKVLIDIDAGEAKKIPNLDLFIHQDANIFSQNLAKIKIGKFSDWLKQCQEWKEKYTLEGKTVSYELLNNLNTNMSPDDILVLSTTGMVGGSIFPAGFKQKNGQRVILSSCGLGSMGAGTPSAVGVAIASGKRVICVDGDGSFMQNIQELEVVFRLQLPITFFVVRNGGYASIRNSEQRAFGRLSGADMNSGLTLPLIGNIAEAFSIQSYIYEPKRIKEYLSDEPKVIEVLAPHDELLIPRVIFDGRGSLEDMWPYE
jgi:acetolactate synthase-1/2/3 large subunit